MLARYRIPLPEIKMAILHLDDSKLSIEFLKALKHYVPSTDELSAISVFEGNITSLSTSDQYFNQVSLGLEVLQSENSL